MHLADIWESISLAVPDAPAVLHGTRRVTWKEYEDRAARFAGVLATHGVGRDAKVGLLLYNCPEFLEAQFGALKARAVPINVNYRYLGDELVHLLDNADAQVLVYHASLADRVGQVIERLPRLRLLVEVDDTQAADAATPTVPGALNYAAALAEATPQPVIERSEDDLYMLYTGGTTGLPKGVMYDVGDVAAAFLHGGSATYRRTYHREPLTDPRQARAEAVAMHAQGRAATTFACPPLMHGAGMWIGAITPHLFGAPVVLAANRSFDGEAFVQIAAEHRVVVAVIVGDAFGRPIADALDRHASAGRHVDLSNLALIASSGAMLSDAVKIRLLEHLPGAMLADLLGSSEGAMGGKTLRRGQPPATSRFNPNKGVKVLRDDGTEVVPGSGEIGIVAVTGAMVPRGYYKDAARSARTFRTINGVRHSFPGDMATVEPDGSVRLLGRGNACINTGGEKVYPEEIEQALATHPDVTESLVFGVDDERLGQRVVAIVALADHADAVANEDIIAVVRQRLSAYKAPREICRVDAVPRSPSGKPDYGAARHLFRTARGAPGA
jgi:acyl-CoA synthetase (AMP-forming)/AMP-acid ligase II